MNYKSIISCIKQYDIIVLLGFLLLISGGMSLLYGRQPQEATGTELSDAEVVQSIKSLDAAQGTKKMVDFISRLPVEQQVRILKTIVADQQSALTPEHKMTLGLGLAAARADAGQRSALLQIILNSPLSAKTPLLYIAAANKYENIASSILSQIPAEQKEQTIFKALLHAIENNNLTAFERLITALKNISSDSATQLLWAVLELNKDAQFVPLLVAQKADVNKPKGPKTPLVAAVDNQNVEMIQMLIDKGADVNKFADPAVGTPLQRVMSNSRRIEKQNDANYKKAATTIELLLRQHGAKE